MAKRGNTIETRCAYAQGMTEKQQIKIYGVTAKDPTFFTRVRTKEENRLEEARRAVISAEALAEAWNQVRNHPESMEAGLKSLITHDGYGAGLPIDAENLQYRFLGLAHAEMVDFIDQNRARWLGFKYNHEGMRDVMREIFGEDTNNADASDLAKQYKSGMVILEKFLYNAGVDVKAVRGVLVPEGHTSWRLSEYNADEYLDIVKNLVDYTKYVDSETGLLMPPADVNSWLRASFNNAISNGSYTRKEESIRQLSSPMAVLVGKETRIHFKNANAWLEYQAKFGEENIFINLYNHMARVARDAAIMSVFGPDPDITYEILKQRIRQTRADLHNLPENKGKIKLPGAMDILDMQYRTLRGMGIVGHDRLASIGSTIRSGVVAITLGKAAIAAIGDVGFSMLTLRFNKMPYIRTTFKQLQGMVPLLNNEMKKELTALGMHAEWAADRVVSSARYNDNVGTKFMSRLADTTLRITGLNAITEGMRDGFALSMMQTIGKEMNRPWAKLSKKSKARYERYGIKEGDFDAMRGMDVFEQPRGVKLISPAKINKLNKAEAQIWSVNIGRMVRTEQQHVSPVDMIAVKAFTTGGLPPNTYLGETVRILTQMKGFPATLFQTHYARGMHQTSGRFSGFSYFAEMFMLTTIFGAFAYQISEIVEGREPLDVDDSKLWVQGALKGGALSLFGQMLEADMSEFRSSLAADLLIGPGASILLDEVVFWVLSEIVMGTLYDSLEDEDVVAELKKRFGARVPEMIRRSTPVLRAWQTRLIFDRWLVDNAARMFDEDADEKFRRKIRRYEKEFDQEYWWEPGENTPN